ncbi:MAG: CHASE2 domain-containing protein [Spirochaetes bacterium]|nr:CHASE2 domain-containing protein [Spirochaetota bacterium]MBU1082234.1 CHASE2 domain-containing protein [Spirochaetota bacterium]
MPKKKVSRRLVFAPLAIGVMFALLYLIPAWRDLENGAYDLFLHLKPAVEQDRSIVLLDIDDTSIEKIGTYPWPRGLLAQGLEALAELDAGYAVFDIEYLDKSPMTVDSTYLTGSLRTEFDTVFEEITSNLDDVFQALAGKRIPLSDAGEYGKALIEYVDDTKSGLYGKTSLVAIENDEYLGQAMRLFGSAYTTLNMQKVQAGGDYAERAAIAKERYGYSKIRVEGALQTESVDFLTPIPEISTMSKSAGFTNVEIDNDGVRRRIQLVDVVGGTYYLQLAMAPLLRRLGEPALVVRDREITLEGAVYPDGVRDVRIPLDKDGKMLIRWPKREYMESFDHIAFHELLTYRADGESAASLLRVLKSNQGWTLGPGYAPIDACIEAWNVSEELRHAALAGGGAEGSLAWLAARREYWKTVGAFLGLGYGESVAVLFDQARDSDDPANAPLYDAIKDDFVRSWNNVKTSYANHVDRDERLRAKLSGAFCIIGWTSTGTTDFGVNPFDESYENVGTHAAVANTILQRDFLSEAPLWVSSLLAILLAGAVLFLIRNLQTKNQILVGLGATVVVAVGCYAVFHFTGLYVAVLSPILSTFASFLAYSLLSFLLSEREKSFLRKAFGTYLSGDVINEIISDPSMLKLGGQKKWITAMFTDVRGFSTISEALDAEQLVKLLNIYLSGMSDLILENRGTIDKYEGDAIISFFGAPVSYKEHATLACRSAILMKRKEAELNERFLAEGMTPNPLLTRIGLNTGDMVVGNMGTERKMDYTIMGNAVNLAARLEGVNKQYGSWILMSDATYKETGDEFLARRFDKVRVVGISTPVQLWELVGFRSEASADTLDFLARFEEAHEAFDARDWRKAAGLLQALSAERPDDGPTKSYIKKCEVFTLKPPAQDWDGVFALTEK